MIGINVCICIHITYVFFFTNIDKLLIKYVAYLHFTVIESQTHDLTCAKNSSANLLLFYYLYFFYLLKIDFTLFNKIMII